MELNHIVCSLAIACRLVLHAAHTNTHTITPQLSSTTQYHSIYTNKTQNILFILAFCSSSFSTSSASALFLKHIPSSSSSMSLLFCSLSPCLCCLLSCSVSCFLLFIFSTRLRRLSAWLASSSPVNVVNLFTKYCYRDSHKRRTHTTHTLIHSKRCERNVSRFISDSSEWNMNRFTHFTPIAESVSIIILHLKRRVQCVHAKYTLAAIATVGASVANETAERWQMKNGE